MAGDDVRMHHLLTHWSPYITAWLAFLNAGGLAKTTQRTRREHLELAARSLGIADPATVTTIELTNWLGSRSWARETLRSRRASLVSFYRWMVLAGHVDTSPAEALPRVKAAEGMPRPAPTKIYRAAIASAEPRTRLILRLAGEVGLRRGEIAQVHRRDLVEDLTGRSLIVHGKGGKTRMVPLPTHVALELERVEGWAFPGEIDGHLSARWVGKLATRALPDIWSLHTLRHRFATVAYEAERDLFAVQYLLGHSSPATTRRYVELPKDALRRAMEAAAL